MKRILISAVLALALAGTTAFAAQNKNKPAPKAAAAKPAASKNAPAATMSGSTTKKKKKKKHHKRAAAKTMDTGNMAKKPAPKKGNTNKK
jgi:hypothetical protein